MITRRIKVVLTKIFKRPLAISGNEFFPLLNKIYVILVMRLRASGVTQFSGIFDLEKKKLFSYMIMKKAYFNAIGLSY